jgi:hypothetical protein
MPSYPRGVVAPVLSPVQQLPRSLVRYDQLAALEVDDKAPVEGRKELRHIT